MKALPTRQQIDGWIDALDRAEPTQSGWRQTFDLLNTNLSDARAFRDIVRWPFIALWAALAIAYVAGIDVGVLGLSAATLSAVLLIWWTIARMRFPVLEIEERVAELLRYYGANVAPGEPH